jgi:VWFA-related protein
MRNVRLWIVALLVAVGTAPHAQSTPTPAQPPQEPRDVIRARANFVRVDVYPTKDRAPVMDLVAEDFEVLEDGQPQTVRTFEHVVITPAGPQPQRVEPSSPQAAERAAANPRSRVFVVFLDVPHVTVLGTWSIREPLIRMIDRMLGPDDLVGIMTPEMAPAQMTLGRKTEVLERGQREGFPWGQRFTLHEDEHEFLYRSCYEHYDNGPPLVRKMIQRRRERLTLEALRDLVLYLQNIRDERKAIVTVTEGWALYRQDPEMMELRYKIIFGEKVYEEMPGTEHVGIGPGGKLTTKAPATSPNDGTKYECDRDRTRLANLDDERFMRDLALLANRSAASFYPVDPRGLAVFDTPIGPDPPLPPELDRLSLRTRQEGMATLAASTDGLAVMNSNDLDAGLRRISDDLSSYYLLGYYSTNTKLDGKFRTIRVRVKRPGVDVRARRGYLAATEEEVNAARAAAPPPPTVASSPLMAALGSLSNVRPEVRFRVHAAPWGASSEGITTVWVTGELLSIAAGDPWAKGGTAEIDVTAGGATTTGRVTIAPGQRAFVTSVRLPKPLAAGPVEVRARLTGTDPAAPRLADTVRPNATPGAGPPLVFRRGPTTGNRVQPAANFQFSRSERVHVEVPLAGDLKPASGRLFDKTGQALSIPVTVGERTDARTGQRWLTADLILAPLGAGDYAIEVVTVGAGEERRVFTAIRVVR